MSDRLDLSAENGLTTGRNFRSVASSSSRTLRRVTLHVPKALNDGSPVPPERFADYEADLLDIADGFTLTHAIGAWRSRSGNVYREALRLYAVDVVDGHTPLQRLQTLADRIAVELAQEVLYLTSAGIRARAGGGGSRVIAIEREEKGR